MLKHCDLLFGQELLDVDGSMRRRVDVIQHAALGLSTIPPDASDSGDETAAD